MHFNVRHERIGHLFQNRYGSARLWTSGRVAQAIEYVERNPVEAHLCAAAEDWAWSSAGARVRGGRRLWLATRERIAAIQAELELPAAA